MYKSLNIADTIKVRAKEKGISLKTMLSDLSLGTNTMSNMRHDRMIAADSLARIADYLDCSVDYLLGRIDTPTHESNRITDSVNTGVLLQGNHADNLVVNEKSYHSENDEQLNELINVFNILDVREKIELMSFVFDLEKKHNQKI